MMIVERYEIARQLGREGTSVEASPWAGLRSHFLESLAATDRAHIFSLSERVATRLDQWAARYPLIRRVRVWPLALSVTAAAPFSSVEALVSSASVSLWVFTLDDIFDEERFPYDDLLRRAERYRAIVRNQPTDRARDSLATALREVQDALARYPLFSPLGIGWAEALCGTIDGMVREYEWRVRYRREGPAMLPTYEAYVACGLYSIGGPPHIWSALITIDDPSTPQHLEHLRPMEQMASTCIRLANDLQSYDKEVAEGKLNSVVILSRALETADLPADAASQQAEARVRADIAHGLDRLAQLRAGARTETGQPEAAIADIARFVCEFYTQYDYHTFVMKPQEA